MALSHASRLSISSKVDARIIESFNNPFSVLSDGLLLIIAFDQCLEPGLGQRQ